MLRRSLELGQYTALRYSDRLVGAGAIASIGSVGDSYDNAQAESLIGLYKLECARRDGPWRGVDDLAAVAAALNSRPRKTLGWRTPAETLNDHLLSLQQGSVATTP